MNAFTHLILTRFNIRSEFDGPVVPDEAWLTHRFQLFDTFCYPSVRTQSNQNFCWLVFFDVDTPPAFRERVRSYAGWAPFKPYYIRSIAAGDHLAVIAAHIHAHSDYLVTTRLDNDDALAVDFVDTLHRCFEGQHLEFINFTNGCIFRRGKVYSARRPSNAFISLIERRRAFRTVWCRQHAQVSRVGRVKEVDTDPMWMQVIHDRNIDNRVVDCIRIPVRKVAGRFHMKHVWKEEESSLGLAFEKMVTATGKGLRAGARRLRRAVGR